MGSPPHTRGIQKTLGIRGGEGGFTPAYAGNTCIGLLRIVAIWVHPRIRGEYQKRDAVPVRVRGSPPHTRGILYRPFAGCFCGGFTPAYAGNTAGLAVADILTMVHPRIRGEYQGL